MSIPVIILQILKQAQRHTPRYIPSMYQGRRQKVTSLTTRQPRSAPSEQRLGSFFNQNNAIINQVYVCDCNLGVAFCLCFFGASCLVLCLQVLFLRYDLRFSGSQLSGGCFVVCYFVPALPETFWKSLKQLLCILYHAVFVYFWAVA